VSSPRPLQGLARWVTAPSTLAGFVGAALGVCYGVVTLRPPPGTLGWLLGITGAVVVLGTGVGDAYEQRGLSTVRALGGGRLPPTREHLRQAVREAFSLPDLSFRINLRMWVLGTMVSGFALKLVPRVPWSMSLRLMYLGAVLGPLIAMCTYLLVVSRARRAVVSLAAAGLSAQEVIEAVPPDRRDLRLRLVAFIALAVLTPALFIGDLILSRADDVLDALLEAASPAQQLQALARFNDGGELLLGCLVAGVGIGAAFLGATALAWPLRAITAQATRIANGDLQHAWLIPAEDEMWAASAAFSTLQAQLTQALLQLRRAGRHIGTTTGHLRVGSASQSAGATEQASALNQTSATTEELARSATQIAGNASEVSALAERTLAAAQRGQHSSESFFASMAKLREHNQHVADSVLRLSKGVQQIG
jgi:hypothetical protein